MSWVKSSTDSALARSQDWPWYWKSYGDKLNPEGKALFADCGIPEANIEKHILSVRDEAWKVFPFPCIGQFWFIEFGISHNPRFHDLLHLLQSPVVELPAGAGAEESTFSTSSSSLPEPNPADPPTFSPMMQAPLSSSSSSSSSSSDPYEAVIANIVAHPQSQRRLLDIGTCVGQDLRMLRWKGAPAATLYGTDLFAGFERVGHLLFRDSHDFRGRFFAADVLDGGGGGGGSTSTTLSSSSSPLERTRGMWDAVSATMMLHQFELEEQRKIAARMVRLLKPAAGSMLLGSNTGQLEAGELQMKPPFVKEGEKEEKKMVFRQSKESMVRLWEEAIEGMGERKQDWRIGCEYDLKQFAERERERKEKGEVRYFVGEGQRRILFSVERIRSV